MKKEQLWGYINKKGEVVIEPKYHGAWDFHEGLAAVQVDWASGYIDKTGAYVIEPKFQHAGPFIDGKAFVKFDGLWGYIRPDGSWEEEPHPVEGNPLAYPPPPSSPYLPPEYVFSEGLASAIKGKKCGYINEEKEFVIKPQFVQGKPFSEGLAAVLISV
ncbi:MAG: WG repeat-containing protein [Muribaculaceae bacterium]|nr:WG repeat-containing protein [Muribaculaceae bacterium]